MVGPHPSRRCAPPPIPPIPSGTPIAQYVRKGEPLGPSHHSKNEGVRIKNSELRIQNGRGRLREPPLLTMFATGNLYQRPACRGDHWSSVFRPQKSPDGISGGWRGSGGGRRGSPKTRYEFSGVPGEGGGEPPAARSAQIFGAADTGFYSFLFVLYSLLFIV